MIQHCKKNQPLLLILALAFCLSPSGLQAQGGMTFSVEVAPVREETVATAIEFTGSIDPWRIIDLSSQVEGQVETIDVEEGESLAADAIVCQIDDEQIQIELMSALAEEKSAQAEFERLTNGYRSEEVQEAITQVMEAEAMLVQAEDEWERQKPLVEKGVISKSEGIRIESALNVAKANLSQARANRDKLATGYRVEEVRQAEAQLLISQARVADVRRRLRLNTIRTPLEAVVTERLKEPGEWVNVGDPIARLVVLKPLKVKIGVPQRYLSQIRPGLEARIKVDGLSDETFKASVDNIVPFSNEGTRNFPVLMKIENPSGLLRSGLFARVLLSLGEEKPSILVPREALQIRGDNLVVLVADPMPQQAAAPAEAGGEGDQAAAAAQGPQPNAMIREVMVKTGNESDEWIVVEPMDGGEIHDGENVVILGGTRLQSGMPVLVLPSRSPQQETAQANTETEGVKQ